MAVNDERAPGFFEHCDALTLAARLPTEWRAQLIYWDPPYSVGTVMTARRSAGQSRGRLKRSKDSAHPLGLSPVAYVDSSDRTALLEMIGQVLRVIHPRLTPTGTLVLHMDHRVIHEAKVLADQILGYGCCYGEIIWAPGNGARGARGFSNTHQTLLLFRATPSATPLYNATDPDLREPYASTSLTMHFRERDESGRSYRERTINGKSYRYYADEGRRRGSVWTDVSAMVANTPLRKEGTGYPTQKPLQLLTRLIRAFSLPGDWVFDPMCGSGTTLIAASQLGRPFCGGDQSPLAAELTCERLRAEQIAWTALPSTPSTHFRADCAPS